MAWEEWEKLKAEAVQGQAAQMQLASSGPGGGPGLVPGPADFASSPARKKAAANAIERDLQDQTRKAGEFADTETTAAVTAFGGGSCNVDGTIDGWATSPALRAAHKKWGGQVKALRDRLDGEKQALRSTSSLFRSTDLGVRSTISGVPSPSPFDSYSNGGSTNQN